jgi:hypothetical protein
MTTLPPLPRYTGETLSCFGKQAFETAREALKALANAPKRRSRGTRLMHYRCDYCRNWHIGGSAK